MVLDISFFRISEDFGMKTATPMRKIGAITKTVIRRLPQPTRAKLADRSINYDESMWTWDLTKLATPPPFKVCVAGIVNETQETRFSEGGKLMMGFNLHDGRGRHVECMAFGRHAENDVIKNEHEVVLYFATGKLSTRGGGGQLWLYDESHVLYLRGNCKTPPFSKVIYMRV